MERIQTHPILGDTPEGKVVNFTYDGKVLQGIEGEPISAALHAAGVMVHRYTKKRHEPRGIFCAIGRCTDCVMVVDGKPNILDLYYTAERRNGGKYAVWRVRESRGGVSMASRYDLIVIGALTGRTFSGG